MHPYRKISQLSTEPASAHGEQPASGYFEELILYSLLVVVGAIPVVPALAERGVLGSEATLGGLMVGAGVLGMFALALRSARRTDSRS